MSLALLMSRKEAVQEGRLFYFTGKPCLNGHVVERRVANYNCIVCEADKTKRFYAENREKALETQRRWRNRNLDFLSQRHKDYKSKNAEQVSHALKEWRAKNADYIKQSRKQWVAENRGKKNASMSRRHAAKLQRSPAWLTIDDWWLMEEAYNLAQLRRVATGFVWHVDHIVPLQGESVSGLHVPWNLQVIPAVENMSKGNRFQ